MKTITFCSIIMVLLSGCEKSESNNGVVPTASFTFTKKASFPIVASFTSTSTGANPIVSFSWNFGDAGSGVNNTSTLANPVHEYNTEGVYSVILTTTDDLGQQDMAMMAVGASLRTETTEPNGASFVYSLAPSYPYIVTFTNTSTDATSNTWNFGEGNAVQNDSTVVHHSYFNPGSYQVSLIASSNVGSDTLIATVDIP